VCLKFRRKNDRIIFLQQYFSVITHKLPLLNNVSVSNPVIPNSTINNTSLILTSKIHTKRKENAIHISSGHPLAASAIYHQFEMVKIRRYYVL
jgi:hypothetical protein